MLHDDLPIAIIADDDVTEWTTKTNWMRAVGAISAQWDHANALVSVSLGPAIPLDYRESDVRVRRDQHDPRALATAASGRIIEKIT